MADQSPETPEWTKSSSGRLERTTSYPSGLVRKERIESKTAVKTIAESYPDAKRIFYSFGEAQTEELGWLQNLWKTDHHTQVALNYRDKKFQEHLFLLDDNHIQISLQDYTFDFDMTHEGAVEALVNLNYHRSAGLIHCTLQSETPVKPIKETPVLPWKESIISFVNFIRTEDPQDLEDIANANRDEYLHYVKENFPSLDHPLVQEADELANDVTNKIVSSFPMDDRDDVIKSLEKSGWQYQLARDILVKTKAEKSGSVKKTFDSQGLDDFLSRLLHYEIEFSSNTKEIPQEILEISGFSQQGFNTKEVESELTTGEKRSKEEATHSYGETIQVQDTNFKVERDEDTITITCSSRNQNLWSASFPLSIPFQKIQSLSSDPEADFQNIRDLVKVNLSR